MKAIETNSLSKKLEELSLEGISFSLEEGSALGLIGPKGSGKTEIIKLLCGLMKADSGSAVVLGSDINADLSAAKEHIGLFLGQPGLPLCMRLPELAELLPLLYKGWNKQKFEKLCARFEIDKEKKYEELPFAARAKLGFALALSHDVKLLLLYEPFKDLEEEHIEQIMPLLRRFMAEPGHSILATAESAGELRGLCTEFIYLDQGRLSNEAPALSGKEGE